MNTIQLWRSEWGDAYHQRNRFTPEQVRPVFGAILDGIKVKSVLEVGSGLGHNLAAIPAKVKTGVEPNQAAREEARLAYPDISFMDGDARDLPFFDSSFDLVLTCGLLIHIPPDGIQQAVEEIARVASRYVLTIEYADVEEREQEYRGLRDVLWRRNYGKLFECWGGMKILRWDDADSRLYPGCTWWLLRKGDA